MLALVPLHDYMPERFFIFNHRVSRYCLFANRIERNITAKFLFEMCVELDTAKRSTHIWNTHTKHKKRFSVQYVSGLAVYSFVRQQTTVNPFCISIFRILFSLFTWTHLTTHGEWPKTKQTKTRTHRRSHAHTHRDPKKEKKLKRNYCFGKRMVIFELFESFFSPD